MALFPSGRLTVSLQNYLHCRFSFTFKDLLLYEAAHVGESKKALLVLLFFFLTEKKMSCCFILFRDTGVSLFGDSIICCIVIRVGNLTSNGIALMSCYIGSKPCKATAKKYFSIFCRHPILFPSLSSKSPHKLTRPLHLTDGILQLCTNDQQEKPSVVDVSNPVLIS